MLDWGVEGLFETLRVLDGAGFAHAAAGRDAESAAAPAILEVPGKGRVLVAGCATANSGVPEAWRATSFAPGAHLLPDLKPATARLLAVRLQAHARYGDVLIVSIHRGANWGYAVRRAHVDFALALVDAGVHVVQGHSPHHVLPLEIRRGAPILYGCGGLVNDHDGIGGHEAYRADLGFLHRRASDRPYEKLPK